MVVKINSKRNVRILLVGDRGVGKTSLILSLVSEEFPEDVPSKAEEITIPADVTPEEVPTIIVDYSSADQTDEQLNEQIKKASVICVVYSVDDDDTIDRISSFWMPLIRQNHPEKTPCPIVLVGNKIDLVDYSTIEGVYSIMEDFSEIETCIECSAKTLKNISEMFYYAQKAVLHPTGPLYCVEKADLTEECQKALIRIFKICDIDNDGMLNDIELNNFQSRCFNAPLQPQVLDDVKAVLKKNIEEGVQNNFVTLKGFLFLHSLFIQRGRNETTWTVLRKFGYDDNLEISKEYLFPKLKVPQGSTTELSYKGQQFLMQQFERFDKDKDQALSPEEFENLFSVCPSPPWNSETCCLIPTNEKGWITCPGFMCQWALMTLTDLSKTFEYLGYLGYNVYENESQISAVQVTREKKIDMAKKQSTRNVYQCHIIGPSGCGKSMFCRNFVQKKIELDSQSSNISSKCAVNHVQVYAQEKILVLREIGISSISSPLQPNEVQCDAAALMYDCNNPKSFEYIARIYIKYFAESKIPVLIVACKNDLEEVKQDYILQPTTFCQKYKLIPPQNYTAKKQKSKDVFVKLGTMAAFPPLRRMVHLLLLRPEPSEWFSQFFRNFSQFGLNPSDKSTWWKAGIGLAVATAFGFLVVKILNASEKLR